ncbi:MAG: M20 family peptidase [Betaproteobacteria bacterium]|nr:MAG: M20 family peptidase [Betaproteobacteria bacterium]
MTIDDRQIHRWVDDHAEEIVELLRSLVRIPSITGNEAAIAQFITEYLESLNLTVERLEAESNRPNLVCTWDSGKPGPTLLLNDHLDMIPPGPLEYWTHPPFAAEIHEGKIYGRATIDTKSGLTTILATVRLLKQLAIPFRGKLLLIFSCDEEVGGRLGMQHLGKLGRLKADLALVTEPTTMQVEIATKGRLTFGITTKGIATHGARPWLGHNAIEDMMLVLEELKGLKQELAQRKHPRLGSPSINVGTISGGTVSNMVPNKCTIEVDRRLLPNEVPANVRKEFETLLDRIRGRHPEFDATLEELVWWPGYEIAEDEPIVVAVSQAFEKVMGRKPAIGVKDAGTDASWINTLGNIPVAMFSPGDGLRAMNADESVTISDLIAATKVVAQTTVDILAAR